jgi:hypothetical protein
MEKNERGTPYNEELVNSLFDQATKNCTPRQRVIARSTYLDMIQKDGFSPEIAAKALKSMFK